MAGATCSVTLAASGSLSPWQGGEWLGAPAAMVSLATLRRQPTPDRTHWLVLATTALQSYFGATEASAHVAAHSPTNGHAGGPSVRSCLRMWALG